VSPDPTMLPPNVDQGNDQEDDGLQISEPHVGYCVSPNYRMNRTISLTSRGSSLGWDMQVQHNRLGHVLPPSRVQCWGVSASHLPPQKGNILLECYLQEEGGG